MNLSPMGKIKSFNEGKLPAALEKYKKQPMGDKNKKSAASGTPAADGKKEDTGKAISGDKKPKPWEK